MPVVSTCPHVRAELVDGVLDLVLDRPSRKNALSVAMYAALSQALAQASVDPQVRVVRLSGAGGTFTSGNDLQDFMQNLPGEDGGPVGDFLRALVAFNKPLVAQVQGHAVGIGSTVLLHCDFALAAADTVFRLPFVSLGLVPEAGSSLLLPAIAGHRKAARLLMLGQAFDAATALDCGLLSDIVAPEELQARSEVLVRQLADLPAGALQATRRLMRAPVQAALGQAMAEEGGEFITRLSSPEAMEAFMAFFEKRAPDFRKLG